MKIRQLPKTFLFVLTLFVCFSACAQIGKDTNKSPGEPEKIETATPAIETQFPQPEGFLNDFSGVLNESDKSDIESVLRELNDKAQIDFAIAIIDSTGGKDIFEYSLAMARDWKLGGKNGGALLLIAIKDRTWHIQIDKRLEKDISNEEVKNIGDLMMSDFKQDNYADGIKKCVEKMISVLAEKQHFDPIKFKSAKKQ
jgi:uncharacterized protein